ncbi:MAG: hypothetical protein EOM07_12650, partial [Clostridia bacterium]|nr:hypothetical protein [Clostridia bacterium]
YYSHDTFGFLTIENAIKQIWEKAINPIVPEAKTFRNTNGTRFERASGQDAIVLQGRAGGADGYFVTVTTAVLNGNRVLTLANGNTTLSTGTMATIDTEQTITGKKELRNSDGTSFRRASGQDGIVIRGNSNGSGSYAVIIQPANLTANRSVTVPDADVVLTKGTMMSTDEEQEVTALKNFSTYPKLTNEDDPRDDLHAVRKKDLDATNTALSDHKNLTTGSEETTVPHGIKQGSGNGFDADKLDGADKDTDGTLSGNSDSSIPTEKAVKTYVDLRLLRSGGEAQQLNGTLYTYAVRPDATGTRDIGTSTIKYRHGYFSGTVYADAFDVTSSRKKKKDIKDYEDSGLEIIDSLKIVSFKYKSDKRKQTHIGIIAEDSPKELLGVNGKTVSMSDSIGVLFKAVQELSKKVKILEEKLENADGNRI